VPTLFTAIVPVANMSGKLDILNSWLKNINSNITEIVIVHDKHDVQTGVELREIIQNLPLQKIILLEGAFGSPGAARNAGLDQAKSRWIVFWDSDDFPDLQEFLRMIEEADVSNYDIAIGGFEISGCNSDEMSNRTLLSPYISEWGSNVPLNPGIWRWAFKREVIGNTRFQNFLMGEDQCFLVSLELLSKKIYIYERSVYLYKLGRPGQLTGNKIAINEITKSIRYLKNLLTRRKRSPDYFDLIILLRQILTAIKLGNFQTKIFGARTISLLIISSLFFNFYAFIKSVKTIYLLSLRHKLIPLNIKFLATGGLGNQLFQLAAGLHLSGEKNLSLDYSVHQNGIEGFKDLSEFILPSRLQITNSFKLSFIQKKIINLCIRMSASESTNMLLRRIRLWLILILQEVLGWIHPGNWTVNSGIGFDANYERRRNDYCIGYFQTYRYLEYPEVRKTIRQLTLRNPSEAFTKNHAELVNLNFLVVHVRLGDYRSERNFGIPSKKYFHDSIYSLWDKNSFSCISLFSNELDAAVDYIPNNLREYLWTPSEDLTSTAETLELMRYGSAYVLSNSSFGWWAAALSYVDVPVVIYPTPWFQKKTDPIDLIPKEWIFRAP
jgi:glycosyltransferase involved in cell wall biosynthesis